MPPDDAPDNVLFIFTDQQRKDSIGAYGGEIEADTPNLDALAEAGVRFERAYTPTAICSPSRSSLVTGLPPIQHGAISNSGTQWSPGLDVDAATGYGDHLSDAGWEAVHVGKWHVEGTPADFGFEDHHDAGGGSADLHGDDYVDYLDRNGLPRFDPDDLEGIVPRDAGYDDVHDLALDPRPVEATFPYWIAERTIQQLERLADGDDVDSFYLNSHFFAPHRPYYLPAEYYEMYDPDDVTLPESAVKESFTKKPMAHEEQHSYWRLPEMSVEEWREIVAGFHGMMTLLDEQIGRILDAVDRLGLRDDTAILFSADHGGFVTGHKSQDKGPMMYEEVYNVPFLADVPGVTESGTVEDAFVSLLDVPPTVLDLADAPIPDAYHGRSLLDLFDGADDWREDIYAEFHGHWYPYGQRMLRTDRYKLVANGSDRDELYDLETDPHELENVINDPAYGDVRQDLYDRLEERLADADDHFRVTDFSHVS